MSFHTTAPFLLAPAPSGNLAALAERDYLAELLADKKSANTRRTYAKSLRDF